MIEPLRMSSRALTPESAHLIETYLDRVQGAMLLTAGDEAADAVEDLRAHVLSELAETDGSPAAVSRVLGALGTPESLAAEYADDDAGRESRGSDHHSPGHGTFLGMPFDVRMPTTERIASRLWNPLDPSVFVPRVFGIGWDINFGAVAVKLGIVRPDDEDEPFATVPEGWLLVALAVPIAVCAVLVAMLVTRYAGMPAFAPSQWDVAGRPSAYWRKEALAAFLLAMSVVPTMLAARVFARRRPALNRVAAAAAATLLSTAALTQFVQTVRTLDGVHGAWLTWVGVGLTLLLPFALLTVLSRIGRAAEQRRDLADRPR